MLHLTVDSRLIDRSLGRTLQAIPVARATGMKKGKGRDLSASRDAKASAGSASPSDDANEPSGKEEDWRGKMDPLERRRIQNRINQRAFRERQRVGDVPKTYTSRKSGKAAKSDSGSISPSATHDSSQPDLARSDSATGELFTMPALPIPMNANDYVWDDLAQVVNRNFKAAVVENVAYLGINNTALQTVAAVLTPRPSITARIPTSLWPIEAQHRLPHDAYIDAIPHAQLRFNIITAIQRGQIDAATLSAEFRASGALENIQGRWLRIGLVVWSSSVEPANWEISEAFWYRWAFLFRGCEDFIAVTNNWRARRGEQPFTIG